MAGRKTPRPASSNTVARLCAALLGVDVRQFGIFEPELAAHNLATVFELAGRGVLRPAIAQRYPLEQFTEALEAARAGQSAGRILLQMR